MSFQDDEWAKHVDNVTEIWTDEEFCTVYEQAQNVYGISSLTALTTEEARFLRGTEAVGSPVGWADTPQVKAQSDRKNYHYRPKPPRTPNYYDGSAHLTCLGDSGFCVYGERSPDKKGRPAYSLQQQVYDTGFSGELFCKAFPGADLERLTQEARKVLHRVQKQCSESIRWRQEDIEKARRVERGAYGSKLEPEREAEYDALKKMEEKSLKGSGIEPVGTEGNEDIGKPFVLGADFVLVIVWNGNELMAPGGRTLLPAEFARIIYEFTKTVKIWPNHLILVSPSSSLWGGRRAFR